VRVGNVPVGIPRLHVTVVALYDSYTTFDQPTCDQHLATVYLVGSVPLLDVFRFTRDVQRIGRLHLHPVSKFEGLDASFQVRISKAFFLVFSVESCQ